MSQECTPVQLPLMGEGVHEAVLVRWLKKAGEKVAKDEPLIEVSTDKVDTEIASPASGYLIALISQEGATVEVNEVMAYISENPEAQAPAHAPKQPAGLNSQTQASSAPKSQAAPLPLPGQSSQAAAGLNEPLAYANFQAAAHRPTPGQYAGAVRSSPLVRKLARAKGINLHEVRGSGLYGRITKADLLNFIAEGGGSRIPRFAPEQSVPSLEASFDPWGAFFQQKTQHRDGREYLDGVPVRREKMSKIRQLTAEHMLRSVRVSPHVTTTFEIDLHQVEAFKQEWGESFFAENGFKLTYTSFFIYAAVEALKQFPEVNAAVDGKDILYRQEINIGCAVAIETGLIVPVIRNAAELSFPALARSLNDLVQRARTKKLSPQDVQGGSFSLTNPGMFGSLHSQPILNQPQVAIMSVGAIIKRPVVVAEQIKIHPLCQVGLTFDHRLIDGEGGAKFLAAVKERLENFSLT